MQDSPGPRTVAAPSANAHAVDYRLLSVLCAHAVIVQIVYTMIRVTISYRTIELGLSPIWVGVITGASAFLPMIFTVSIGRFVDRGNDILTARAGSVIILGCALGYRMSSAGLVELLVLTTLLGVGHTLLMVSQQMLVIRSAGNDISRETAFGHYMLANALGQGIGPLIVGWLGGAQRIPPTRFLFGVAAVMAVAIVVMAIYIRVREGQKTKAQAGARHVPLPELLGTRGVPTLMMASVLTVTAQDLIVIYLPLLGAQRGIDVANIGILLMVRSAMAVISRVFYTAMIRAAGRVPLTVGTMAGAAFGLVAVAIPLPLPMLYVAMAVAGFGLGAAATLSISNMVDIVPPSARAVALSLRITGNRFGQVSLPTLAGFVASATGADGIFAIMALSLALSAASVHVVRGAKPQG